MINKDTTRLKLRILDSKLEPYEQLSTTWYVPFKKESNYLGSTVKIIHFGSIYNILAVNLFRRRLLPPPKK